jgi:hypothetical protein
VICSVITERLRQCQLKESGKFLLSCADPQPNSRRLAILAEEFGEVAREVSEENDGRGDVTRLRMELVQVAAVCLAWIEGLES